jgi:L-histidine Nalpha-methyltransferase
MDPLPSASVAPPRFSVEERQAGVADFASDVRIGLSAPERWLPPRWFYDDLGSALFDAICFLPEYYVLRAETEALTTHAKEIVDAFAGVTRLVELGSGTARKTRILLDELTPRAPNIEYVPVDIDAGMLEKTGNALLEEYPSLRVTALRGDIADPVVTLRGLPPTPGRTVVLFLGSTIGNFDPPGATAMLTRLRQTLSSGDMLLLGADLRKARAILEPAYDDVLGVTAAFNLNLLARINRELGGHFDLTTFRHHARYDEEQGRIEMRLISKCTQSVRIDALDLTVEFSEGESIYTESSYKHDESTLAALAASSGFRVSQVWTDAGRRFADVLLEA